MKPGTILELQEMVRECPKLLPVGGGSKTGLSGREDGATAVNLSGLDGMLEYQPDEYTFAALAGTPVSAVERVLAGHGQYLPFDPLLVERGATLGGAVASGLSGPGRYRFGGVRDFLLGVQFVDGQGNLVRGGGRVVKNAAGFDLPKLMVGSLGTYGALTELAFKVFPKPLAHITYQAGFPTTAAALEALLRLAGASLDLFALDLEPSEAGPVLQVRLGGEPELFGQRVERIRQFTGPGETLEGPAETEYWRGVREFTWLNSGDVLVKVPLTPAVLPSLDAQLAARGARRRYSVAANLAWVGWPGSEESLDVLLSGLELSGLVVLGKTKRARLGVRTGDSFARRVKQALDPLERWMEV